jgi:hypothetical protein
LLPIVLGIHQLRVKLVLVELDCSVLDLLTIFVGLTNCEGSLRVVRCYFDFHFSVFLVGYPVNDGSNIKLFF